MSLGILRDRRVRSVAWQDLVPLSRVEVVKELCLSLPWLVLSLGLAQHHWYVPALLASFTFFLTGLRQVHNAYHYALGISRAASEWVMFGLSLVMLGSMHAVQVNHLRHHKHCLDKDDVEGWSARLSALQAILVGPLFPLRMHFHALKTANKRQRVWIITELLATSTLILIAFLVLESPIFRYHFMAMAVGQCLTAFFAVWTVHHDCDRSWFIARTLRGRFKNLVSYSMFFHLEHHLFPRVPTCHLALLADRLDRMAPDLQKKRVF